LLYAVLLRPSPFPSAGAFLDMASHLARTFVRRLHVSARRNALSQF